MKTDIFISYRRDGGDMTAMYIYQALKDRGYNVFYDVEVLRSGKFNEELLRHIQEAQDFILVLSPHALDRCSDPNDWVRQEIAEAIKDNKNIVPVMMNGFQFPDDLPEEIASVRYRTGLTSSTEYFQESINRLCEKFLKSKPKKKWVIPAAVCLAFVILGALFLLRPARPASPVPEAAPAPTASPVVMEEPKAESPAEEKGEAESPAEEQGEAESPTEEKSGAENAAEGRAALVRTNFPVLSSSVEMNDRSAEQEVDEDGVPVEYEQKWPVMGNAEYTRDTVRSITFLPGLDAVPESAWDVSEERDGKIQAWLEPNGELYDLYIAGDGGVKILDAPETSQLFSGFCNAESISFNGCVDLSEREDFGHMFWGCHSLTGIDFSGVSTESVRNLNGMFAGCRSLPELDLSFMETYDAADMSEMFLDCVNLRTIRFGNFETLRVRTMASMFFCCTRLREIDVSGFDTSRVENMNSMFHDCKSLVNLDLSGWNTAVVTDMSYMFSGSDYLDRLDLTGFDTEKTEDMSGMFQNCSGLREVLLSGWNVENVKSMREIFAGCSRLESIGRDTEGFGHGDTTDMYHGCEKLQS